MLINNILHSDDQPQKYAWQNWGTQRKSGEKTMAPRETVTENSDAPSSVHPVERDGLKENILRMV